MDNLGTRDFTSSDNQNVILIILYPINNIIPSIKRKFNTEQTALEQMGVYFMLCLHRETCTTVLVCAQYGSMGRVEVTKLP